MRKIYKTYELKSLVIPVAVDGKKISVEFKGGCMLGSTATYTTSDEEIQKELESLVFFNRDYYLDRKIDDAPKNVVTPKVTPEPEKEEEIEVVDMLDAQTFKNLVELRNALQDKGIDVSMITNVKAAESLAKKNGYNYTVEKKA